MSHLYFQRIMCKKKGHKFLIDIKSQIKDDIISKVDNFSEKFDDKTISVHIRSGTGHPIEGISLEERRAFNLEETIKVMESYSNEYTFFVSTDEYVEQGEINILNTLREKFGDSIFYYKTDSLSLKGALIDLLLLSKNNIISNDSFSEGAPKVFIFNPANIFIVVFLFESLSIGVINFILI